MGVRAAIEAVGGAGAPPAQPAAEQLDIETAIAATGGASSPPGPPQAPVIGRPKGAQNRSSREWRAWFAGSGRQPLEFLASVYRQSTEELAAKLDCSPLAALEKQIQAANACLPYAAQKQPLAIEDLTNKGRPVIVIGQLSQAQQNQVASRFGFRLAGGDGKGLQNQAIVDVEAEKSDGA